MPERVPPEISSFAEWRGWVTNAGLQPVVVVAGSRGKTIVAKVLETVLQFAGLRVATWSSHGVDIDGIRQIGELGPWQDVETALENGEIDIAIREVDWATASTLATGPRLPILAVTNVCANREDCVLAGDAQLANAAMPALLTAVVNQGWLILNGEDLAVAADHSSTGHNRLLVGLGLDGPVAESHLATSSNLAWLAGDQLVVLHNGRVNELGDRRELAYALDGRANFMVFDTLMAASLATVLGIDAETIRSGLRLFASDPESIPGSFNVLSTGSSVMILDTPSGSWHLRPVFRALRDYHRARLLTVFSGLRGTLPDDTAEIGRLLGRISNILIVSDDEPSDVERISLATEGARRNELPPMLIPVGSEIDGVRRAMGLARPKDVIYILSDDPAALWAELAQLGPLVHLDRSGGTVRAAHA
jgi:cyanophycin synthetase